MEFEVPKLKILYLELVYRVQVGLHLNLQAGHSGPIARPYRENLSAPTEINESHGKEENDWEERQGR